MKSVISAETLMINDKEYTLVSVTNGPNSFGICDTTKQRDKHIRETMFVANEALINVVQRSINDPYSNKIIVQNSSIERCGDFPRRVTAACEDYFYNNKNVITALQPLLDYIKNGLYVIYEQEMVPTDGAGNFFWTGYLVGHELTGSGSFNPVCKKERPLPPAFLVPTMSIGGFSDKLMKVAHEKVKVDNCAYGICIHLTGMFCALLSNHYEATAALMQDKKIKCLVIEPIRSLILKDEMLKTFGNAETAESEAEQPEYEDCLYSCCANIPMSKVPVPILETFFLTRRNQTGKYSESVTANSEKPLKMRSKRSFPEEVIEKCDRYPDCEMLQSSALVGYLSDEELNALLNGETMLNEKYIINQNYYSSITIAFNYLQYKDFGRFISFASSIMQNENLTAIHQYVASRLQPIMDQRIAGIFEEVMKSENDVYNPIKPYADHYIKRFNLYKENVEKRKEAAKRAANEKPIVKADSLRNLDSLDLAKTIKSEK